MCLLTSDKRLLLPKIEMFVYSQQSISKGLKP